jgi:peptide/nickel transport system ATP-binding protein
VSVVRQLNLTIHRGEVVGLLGESGCGKTTATLAMLGLLPPGAVVDGSVRFRGLELAGASEKTLQETRGAQISFILQEPSLSLNPVIRVIDQVAQVVRVHQRCGARDRRERARAALQQAGLNGSELHTAYPHQLSGGQRQRVLIAQAIVCRPSLVIADEPTGSLDAASAREILLLLRGLVLQSGTSLLLITHDPGVLGSIADRVMVMYAGRLVEEGPTHDVLRTPLHPYTRGLLGCLLDPAKDSASAHDRHVPAIPGTSPDFHQLPRGCSFEPRCPDCLTHCSEREPAMVSSGSRQVSCFLYGSTR